MGLSWLLLAITVGFQPTEFRLDTDTPDALCPELAMTRDTVRKRLGTLEVEGGGTWQGRYSTVHDPTGSHGDYVRLVIIDPAGAEKAVRQLPIRGESCATVAQAIALVIDGFFRDLGQAAANDASLLNESTPAPGATPPHTESESASRPTNLPTVSTESTPAITTASLPRNSGHVLGIIAGSGYESVPGSAVGSFGLFGAMTSRLRTDLRFSVPWRDEQHELKGGAAHLRLFPLRLALTYDVAVWDELRLFMGPEVLVSFEKATTSNVESGKSGWRAAFGPGARGGAAYWLLPGIALVAGFSADHVLLKSRRFLLEGDSEFDVAKTRLAGMFELWGAIFP